MRMPSAACSDDAARHGVAAFQDQSYQCVTMTCLGCHLTNETVHTCACYLCFSCKRESRSPDDEMTSINFSHDVRDQ